MRSKFSQLPLLTLTLLASTALVACGGESGTTGSASETETGTGTTGETEDPTTGTTATTSGSETSPSGSDSMSDSETTGDPTEEPTTEEPTTDGPTTEEPTTEEPTTEEPTTDEPTTATDSDTDPTDSDSDTDTDTEGTTGDVCVSNDDCLGNPDGEVCNLDDGTCVVCTPEDDPCALGSYCNPDTLNCIDGCLDDSDCNDGFLCVNDNSCLDVAESCLAWLNLGEDQDGMYQIDPDGDGPIPQFETFCDQTTDGGGWTQITLAIACSDVLGGSLTAVQPAPEEGIDQECRPFSTDAGGDSTYHYTIPFPPGFTEFSLNGFKAKARAIAPDTSEYDGNTFVQAQWDIANGGCYGDVSYGSGDMPGPVTSFAAQGGAQMCTECEIDWPEDGVAYTVQDGSTSFRMGWGEGCGQDEGWYPWWEGTIHVR